MQNVDLITRNKPEGCNLSFPKGLKETKVVSGGSAFWLGRPSRGAARKEMNGNTHCQRWYEGSEKWPATLGCCEGDFKPGSCTLAVTRSQFRERSSNVFIVHQVPLYHCVWDWTATVHNMTLHKQQDGKRRLCQTLSADQPRSLECVSLIVKWTKKITINYF